MSPRQQQQQLDKPPSEPTPYSVPMTANKCSQTGSERAPTSFKKKPPVKPRRLKSLRADVAVVAGGGATAMEIRSERPRGKTFAGNPKSDISRRVEWERRRKTEVRRSPEEGGAARQGIAEYLKVVL